MDGIKSFMQSRTLWALFVAMVAWTITHFHLQQFLGVDPDNANSIANWIFDKAQPLALAAAAYFRAKATKTLVVKTPPTTPVLVMFLGLWMLALPGCDSFFAPPPVTLTPLEQMQADVANDTAAYIVAATLLEKAHTSGSISNSDWVNVWQPAESIAFTYLGAAQIAAAQGNPITYQQQRSLFTQALAKLAGVNLPPIPATLPATHP